MKTYLVTGAAGFIGTNFVKYMLEKYSNIDIIVLDKLTYAGKKENLQNEIDDKKITFIQGDIGNYELVRDIFTRYDIDYVVNFAAESHVDRSISSPKVFLETNILGTQNLLQVAKEFWQIATDKKGYPIYKENKKFIQISTDEVYGSLTKDYETGIDLILSKELEKVVNDRSAIKTYGKLLFNENTPLNPKSPYSASKASADMLVMAYYETYKFPVNITRCSNNYGPYQFPEKLIPLIINNILEGKKLPVYGDGSNVRDWLYVKDHNKAVDMVITNGKIGEIYNIGGFNEKSNIDIVKLIIDTIATLVKDEKYKKALKTDVANINYDLITYVQDRLGHDKRYAIDPTKIAIHLGWYPETTFEKGIVETIKWYINEKAL